jgi:hypothetical protein
MLKMGLLGIAVLVTLGCEADKKESSQFDGGDGGMSLREECFKYTDACWSECEHRDAGIDCGGCCRRQDSLCMAKQRHSFEACKRVP